MAQQVIPQDINIEQVLKGLSLVEGATEYLVLNAEGIPIKKSPTITPERALHIAFLIQDYWLTVKKVINNDLRMHDNTLKNIRIRTAKQQQIILIQSYSGDATLYLVQNCARKEPEVIEEKKQVKQ